MKIKNYIGYSVFTGVMLCLGIFLAVISGNLKAMIPFFIPLVLLISSFIGMITKKKK